MKTIDTENLRNWYQALTLVKALGMERNYGCQLSPYANVLLENLNKVTKESLKHAKGQEYDSY